MQIVRSKWSLRSRPREFLKVYLPLAVGCFFTLVNNHPFKVDPYQLEVWVKPPLIEVINHWNPFKRSFIGVITQFETSRSPPCLFKAWNCSIVYFLIIVSSILCLWRDFNVVWFPGIVWEWDYFRGTCLSKNDSWKKVSMDFAGSCKGGR